MQPAPAAPADLLLLLALLVGLLLVPMGLPGLWLMVGATAVYRVAGEAAEFGVPFLLLLAALAAVAELAEALLGVLAARRFGATRWGMWGAFLGGIAGAIAFTPLLPVVGTLIGAFVGAFAGAFLLELKKSRTFRSGWRAGLGAFLGRAAAVGLKTAIGLTIAVLVLLRLD